MAVVVSTIALLSLVLPQVRASLLQNLTNRQSSGGHKVFLTNLTLVTNSPLNCSTGLTHPGVFVLVEYRLVERQTVGEWQLLESVTMEPTDHGCSVITTDLYGNQISNNASVQLRIVQPEHGGGSCNCWGMTELIVNRNVTIELQKTCNKIGNLAHTSIDNCQVEFCGGSASTPREVVYPPINLTDHHQTDCLDASSVVDVKGTPPANCTSEEQKIEISFKLDFRHNSCDRVDNFDEGVEVSAGNWDRGGYWIPFHYYAIKEDSSNIGPLNTDQHTIGIRGYNVPYTIQNEDDDFVSVNLSICSEEILKDGIQFRWLQTASLLNDIPYRDVLSLDDVSIVFYDGNHTRHSLLDEKFNSSSIDRTWKLRNCGVVSEPVCGNLPANIMFLGANCTTLECEKSSFITVSRLVATPPLNLSSTSEKVKAISVSASHSTSPVKPTSVQASIVSPSQVSKVTFPLVTTAISIMTMPLSSSSNKMITINSTSTQQISPQSLTNALYTHSTVICTSSVPPSQSMSTYSTTISTSSVMPSSTPSGSVDIKIYETVAREDLVSTRVNIENIIGSSTELSSIQQKPAVEAVASLAKLVTEEDTSVMETVIAYLLKEALTQARNINDTEKFSQNVLEVIDGLIAQTASNNESNTISGSTLLTVTELLTLTVLTPKSRDFSTPNIELRVFEVDTEEEYFTGIDVRMGSIQVPSELLRTARNGIKPITVASVYYKNMSGLLPGTLAGSNDSTVLASPVLSTSLQCGEKICDTSSINSGVIITVPHSERFVGRQFDEIDTKCVFWKFIEESDNPLVSGRWDTDGCVKNGNLSNSTQTVCECTHLTNFAILLSTRPLTRDPVHSFALGLIGYLGVSLSVLAMLGTIVALTFLKSIRSMRNFIHVNLCVSLIMAQVTFVIGVTPYGGGEEVGPGCRTAAVVMHYLFLVSFMWMLMEGVVLYVALVTVSLKHQKRYLIGFFAFSYGAPLMYMVLSVPLGLAIPQDSGYGYGYKQVVSDTANIPSIVCWLNPYSNFVWVFIVPVLTIILLNVGFFIMTIVIMRRHAKRKTYQSKVNKAIYWIKSSVSLVTIMGLTWIVGILVFEVHGSLPLAYIFTIFVALQGVTIFIIFVPLSKQVRVAYSKWWKIRMAKSEFLSRKFGGWSLTKGSSSTGHDGVQSLYPISPNLSNSPSNSYILESTLMKTDQPQNNSANLGSRDNTFLSVADSTVAMETSKPGHQTNDKTHVTLAPKHEMTLIAVLEVQALKNKFLATAYTLTARYHY